MIFIILTEKLINEIVEKNVKCTYLNDDYVILYKSMEVCDNLLEDYFLKIKKAQESGINIPKVIEYKLLSGFNGNASKGIFVEERAKGNVLNIRGIVLRGEKEYNFENIILEYLNRVELYLIELEKRANANQKIYDKFLSDFLSLYNFGLIPDPNSLNYLFDSGVGFTIIDPYFSDLKLIQEKNLFSFIINDIYGVSRPIILIKKDENKPFYGLPNNLKSRLDKYSKLINEKIWLAFRKKGYSTEYILEGLEKNKMRFYTEKDSLEVPALIIKLEQQFYDEIKSKKI